MIRKEMVVQIAGGLEARPIAVLVQVASQYESRIYLEVEEKRVNAKSIMGMMSLSVRSGDEVIVITNGDDEAEAAKEIETYLINQ